MSKDKAEQHSYKNKIFTIPNVLSLFRLCLIPVIIWMYCAKQDYIGTAALLLLSGATDILDGFIARHFNMISDLGKVLDPIADKLTQGAALICLLTRYPLMIAPIVLLLSKEIYLAITGAIYVKKTGIVPSAKWHGKAATVMLHGMIFLHLVWIDIPGVVSNIAIGASIVMMVISLILYNSRNMSVIRNKNVTQKR